MFFYTPAFVVSGSSEALQRVLSRQLEKLSSVTRWTKGTSGKWKAEFLRELQESQLTADAATWLSSCLHMEAMTLGASEVGRYYVEAHWLFYSEMHRELEVLFDFLQARISERSLGLAGVNQTQHNLLQDLSGSEDPLSPSDLAALPSGVLCYEGPDIPPLLTELLDAATLSTWAETLRQHPHLWPALCRYWAAVLRQAYAAALESVAPISDGANSVDRVVDMLRRARLVPPSVFRTDAWSRSVKTSELASMMTQWSDPRAMVSLRSALASVLFRKHRLDYTLSVILLEWTPSPDTLAEREPALDLLDSHRNIAKSRTWPRSRTLCHGRDLFRFLVRHPGVVPVASSPSSAYFLLGEENFYQNWNEWFLATVLEYDYDPLPLYGEHHRLRSEVFRQLHAALRQRLARNPHDVADPLFRVVLERTKSYRDLHETLVSQYGYLLDLCGRQSLRKPCNECAHLPEHEQCVQTLLVDVLPADLSLQGCGASPHPREKVLNPKVAGTKRDAEKKVLHPQRDMKLQEISCDEKIVKRCGLQIFRIEDRKTRELRDFWAYNVFTPPTLQRLSEHTDRYSRLKSVTRGKQFTSFVKGKMCPIGERTPSGGAPGDCHRFYDHMDASSEESLQCLFDHAEDSLIFSEINRLIAPHLAKEIYANACLGERLGESASTLFYCRDYAAPFHFDRDVGPGLCAMLEVAGGPLEYAFINTAYPFYFAPRANSFWSFRGSDLHGTTLPAVDSANRLRGGAAAQATTLHRNKTERNAASAQRYRRARLLRSGVKAHWNV